MKILFPFCCLVAMVLASCLSKEVIPPRAEVAVKRPDRIQKSVLFGTSKIFLQTRKKGILTNDLMMEAEDGAVRHLSDNRYFISDFCVSGKGVVYYVEAGLDRGYEVGTRGHDFKIKKIDLNHRPYRAESILSDRSFAEPNKVELSRDQRLLCFATRFGDIHIIDLNTLEDIKILPGGMVPAKVCGFWLTPDKTGFKVSVQTGSDASGAYIWEERVLPLP